MTKQKLDHPEEDADCDYQFSVTGISKEEWFAAHKVLSAWLKNQDKQKCSGGSSEEEVARIKNVADAMLYTLESNSDAVEIYSYDNHGILHVKTIIPRE